MIIIDVSDMLITGAVLFLTESFVFVETPTSKYQFI